MARRKPHAAVTRAQLDGGGVLGIFINHCFHYLEWFCAPIAGLSARIAGLSADGEMETTVAMAITFEAGLLCLSMSCASYLGIGHRIEFFGEDGTLVLHNPGADYMRGFELYYAKPPAEPLRRIDVIDTTRATPTGASRRCHGWPRYFSTPPKAAARRRPDLPKATVSNG